MKALFLVILSIVLVAGAGFPKTVEWSNVKIGGGGFLPGLIFNPSLKGLAYLRTDIGGLYRLNADESWTPITDVFDGYPSTGNYIGLGAESVATDPKDPNRLYYAAGLYTGTWAPLGSIYSSTNKGDTWTTRWNAPFRMGGNDDGRSAGERLAVNPINNNVIYYGSQQDGLWKSQDYGANFTQVSNFPVPERLNGSRGVVFVKFYTPDKTGNTIIVGVQHVNTPLYKTTNGGATWNLIPNTPLGFFVHQAEFTADGKYFIVSMNNVVGPNLITNGFVYRLDMSTGQWTNITPVAPTATTTFGYAAVTVDMQRASTLMVATLDRWALIDDIFRSNDYGLTWKSVRTYAKLNYTDYPFLYFGASPSQTIRFGWWMTLCKIDPFDSNKAYYGTGAAILGTKNLLNMDSNLTTNWDPKLTGVEETAIMDLSAPPSGPTILHSAILDLCGFSHTNLAVSPVTGMWGTPRCTSGYGVSFAQFYPNVVVRVGDGAGYAALSTDHGASWTVLPKRPSDTAVHGKVDIAADAKAIVWTPSGMQPYFSLNNGTSWTLCGGFTTTGGKVVMADRVTPSIFYAYDITSYTVYKSTNYGQTFSTVSTRSGTTMRINYAVAGDLWIPSYGGLYHSTNGGANFTLIPGITFCEDVGFGKAYTGSAYTTIYMAGKMGTSPYGVYASIDGGATWSQINDANNQWGQLRWKIAGDPNVFGRVFIATNGRGIIMGSIPASTTTTIAASTTTTTIAASTTTKATTTTSVASSSTTNKVSTSTTSAGAGSTTSAGATTKTSQTTTSAASSSQSTTTPASTASQSTTAAGATTKTSQTTTSAASSSQSTTAPASTTSKSTTTKTATSPAASDVSNANSVRTCAFVGFVLALLGLFL